MKIRERELRALVIFCIMFVASTAVMLLFGHNKRRQPQANIHAAPFAAFGMPSEPLNILIMGVDLNYSKSRMAAQPETNSFAGRTDSIMLLRVDPARGIVAGLNIPRDTMVTIAGHGVDRINAANAYGGPIMAEQAVSDLTSLPINHYFMLNIQGLIDCVNELGGVTVAVPKKMRYMDWTAKLKIDLEPGVHTLTGNQAMGFVRFRHDELGDIGRIQRQQLFMHALKAKLATPASWSHVARLMQIMRDSVSTDLSAQELFQLFNYARTLSDDQIKFVMLPGHFGPNGSWIPDKTATRDAVTQLYGSFPLTDQLHAISHQSAVSQSVLAPVQ